MRLATTGGGEVSHAPFLVGYLFGGVHLPKTTRNEQCTWRVICNLTRDPSELNDNDAHRTRNDSLLLSPMLVAGDIVIDVHIKFA